MRFAREVSAFSIALAITAFASRPAEGAPAEATEVQPSILTMTYTEHLPAGFTPCVERTYPNTPKGDAQRETIPPKWDCGPSGTTVTDYMIDYPRGRASTPIFSVTTTGHIVPVPNQNAPWPIERYNISNCTIAVVYGPSQISLPDGAPRYGRNIAAAGISCLPQSRTLSVL